MGNVNYFLVCYITLWVIDSNFAKNSDNPQNHNGEEYKTLQNTKIPKGYVDGKFCNRECNGQSLSCFFNFKLESFYTMGKPCFNCPSVISDCWRLDCIVGGGISRTVTVINRQMPGPAIEVCQGDKVMVFLQNKHVSSESTTLHWHGQHMVRNKYMDGTPMVTQCPILNNNNFTYEFWADNYGTFWWHSHSGMQRGDGVYGALIVREPSSKNPHAHLYDFDLSSHVMQVSDWNDRPRLDVFEAYAMTISTLGPTGILVNGLGYQSTTNITNTPLANFTVQSGYRYRFRLINVGFADCPLEVSIDGHKMLIIATDAHYLKPFEVDSFVSTSGERFDFILNASQPISTYYIRIKGYLSCKNFEVYTFASLIYQGSTDSLPTAPLPTYNTSAPTTGVLYNPVSIKNATENSKVIGIQDPEAMEPLEPGLKSNIVYKYYITLGMSKLNNPSFNKDPYYGFDQVADTRLETLPPQFNHITNEFMDSPLLPARFKINSKEFCNEETMRDRDCEHTFCQCPHVLQVPENAIVEFVFLDLFKQDQIRVLHPIHLHGYSFSVLGWGEIGRNLTKEQMIRMDEEGQLKRNFINPPLKDTVTVPKGGYTIIRFKADNIGYWLMHCHVGYHNSEGMELVLKVGDNFLMPRVPKHFPECGNYQE